MKSKIETVADLAMKVGRPYLAEYGATRSRHDFTQRQLMACLVLRAYLKTTYRGFVDILTGHTGLREVLGMRDKVPHYTTLQKFSARSQVLEITDRIIAHIGRAALQLVKRSHPRPAVAMDATGLETTIASAHFMSRAGRERRKWLKVSLTVVREVEESGFLRRQAKTLRVVTEATPVSITVQDMSARGSSTSPRALQLDISTLSKGAYVVQLEIEVAGQYIVRADHRIEITGR